MAATRNTSLERLEAKESSILDAAERIFSKAGFDGAKISDISRAASVAEGTVYLYYRNKQDLLNAVVARFWADLTLGAEAAINPEASAPEQLEQLASYHLQAILNQFEVVQLTYRARPQQEQDLDQVRNYVRIFDRIMQRGIDRNHLPEGIIIWQLRDVFFGTLEFSARTLKLRDQPYDHSIVNNLLDLIIEQSDSGMLMSVNKEPSNRDLMGVLESIREKLGDSANPDACPLRD